MIVDVRKRRLIAVSALVAAVTLSLSGCTPAEETALRLNDDGSVDFVSCEAVSDVAATSATTTFRSGPNGQIDDSTATSVSLDPTINRLDAGQAVRFSGLPTDWDRLDVAIEPEALYEGAHAYAERDRLTVGEWHWMGDTGLIPYGAPCAIEEPDS